MNKEHYQSLVSRVKAEIKSDDYVKSGGAMYTAMGMRDMIFCYDGDGSEEYKEITNIIDSYFNGDESNERISRKKV